MVPARIVQYIRGHQSIRGLAYPTLAAQCISLKLTELVSAAQNIKEAKGMEHVVVQMSVEKLKEYYQTVGVKIVSRGPSQLLMGEAAIEAIALNNKC